GRLGRVVSARRRPRAHRHHRAAGTRRRRESDEDCRRDLHLQQHEYHRRRTLGVGGRHLRPNFAAAVCNGMVIYLAGEAEEQEVRLDELTPRQIVAELDKHVVGQNAAKRAVAIALRNRVRRKKLSPDLAADVIPKNIIMIGSTGVGKTEIARRLARMSSSPFMKVEASKFTEVGYVGRDVESMIRDLTEIALDMTRQEKIEEIADKAELNVEERVLDLLLPPPKSSMPSPLFD